MHFNPLNVRCVLSARIAGLLAIVLGALGVVAWNTGHLWLSSFGDKYTSMSPYLATYLIVCGVALVLTQSRAIGARRLAIPFCILVALLGAYDLVPWLFGANSVPSSVPI